MPLTNVQTRDVDALLHPYTALHTLRDTGPLVLDHGKGVHVFDTHGKSYIEGMSGLWCAGLGFGDEELIAAAKEQLDRLPYYHLFGGKSMSRPSNSPKSSRSSRPSRPPRCSSPPQVRRRTTPR